MSNGIDQSLYFIECDFGKLSKAFVETGRDSNSRKDVIENILSGEYRDVVTVLECNPVERTCRDVTEDILNEVVLSGRINDADEWLANRIAWERDHAHDLRKHEVV